MGERDSRPFGVTARGERVPGPFAWCDSVSQSVSLSPPGLIRKSQYCRDAEYVYAFKGIAFKLPVRLVLD